MRLYEGMFVIDSSIADRKYDEVCEEIESIIAKHGGTVVDLRKWDERRLAYEINRARRGTYILVHFETPPASMEELRRDFTLSENILRHLLLVDTDGVPTGDERPGITTSISEASHRRRSSRPRRSQDEAKGGESKEGEKEKTAEKPETPEEGAKESGGKADKAESESDSESPARGDVEVAEDAPGEAAGEDETGKDT